MKKAVLLIGHGSRLVEANEALVRLCDLVTRKRPGTTIAHGFLQLAKPDIQEAFATLDEEGVEEVTVVPVFLYEGVHIREDIPAVLEQQAIKHPHMRLILAPVMGIDERIADIIWDRVDASPQS